MTPSIALPLPVPTLEPFPRCRLFIKTSQDWIEASTDGRYWGLIRDLDYEFFWTATQEDRIEGFWPYLIFPEEWPPGSIEDHLYEQGLNDFIFGSGQC